MAGVEYRLFGPLEVLRGGEPLALGRRQQRAVLAILLLAEGRPVSTDELVERLWHGRPPTRPATAVQGFVSHLRRLLGADAIETTAGGYRLLAEEGAVDLRRFEELVDEGRAALISSDAAGAAGLLRAALELRRGDPLADFAYEPWAQTEISRVEELDLTATEDRLEAELRLGGGPELVPELEALVGAHPLRERLRGQLMLALYRGGRQADALEEFRRARQTLVDELGLDPGPELKSLQHAILAQDPSLTLAAPTGAPKLRAPVAASSFVGREREVAEIAKLLEQPGLVTLLGPGGTGKTRLALEVARRLEVRMDGVLFVALAPITDPALVLPTVARALGASEDVPPTDAIAAAVRGRRLLIVLDNFEQVVEAASLVARLASALPTVSLLVTSRAMLRVAGARQYDVPPLALPNGADLAALEASDAGRLFLERARGVDPGFELDAVGAAAVAEICRRLDGLPLALELAAARTQLLGPAELAARLDARLRVLAGGTRDLPDRQRTLRAAIDWSHELLDAEARRFFRLVAVFPGSFTAAAAEEVCGDLVEDDDVLQPLESLLGNSLIRRRVVDGEVRFSLLAVIREYARERLHESGDEDEIRRRHAAAVVSLAREAAAALQGADQAVWLRRLEPRLDDVRAALELLLESEPELALEVVNALHMFWYLHGYLVEGGSWIDLALARSEPEAGIRARALRARASLHEHLGDFERAREVGEQGLALAREAGDDAGVAAALNNLGGFSVQQGDYERARQLFRESIEIKARLGNHAAVGLTLSNLAIVETKSGAFEVARATHEEALEILRGVGQPTPIANSLSSLAELELLVGDASRARGLVDEVLAIRRDVGDRGGLADALITLSRVELADERADLAAAAAADSLSISAETGDREGVAAALEAAGDATAARDPVRAVVLRGAAERLREEIGSPLSPIDSRVAERVLRRVRTVLNDDAFAQAWSEGRLLTAEQAIDAVLPAGSPA